MKNAFLYSVVFYLIVGTLSCNNCEDPTNPECKNYDPCHDEAEVIADFGTYKLVRDSLLENDTLQKNGYITFKAEGDYDSYEWYIGEDPRVRTEKEFFLSFDDIGDYEIKLIVSSTPSPCFPNDDGKDTIIKNLHLVDREVTLIAGDYEGYLLSNPSHIFTVNIVKMSEPGEYPDYRLHNLNEGCNNLEELPSMEASNDYFYLSFGSTANGSISSHNNCRDPKGIAVLAKNRQDITISYSTHIVGDYRTREFDTFIGKRK